MARRSNAATTPSVQTIEVGRKTVVPNRDLEPDVRSAVEEFLQIQERGLRKKELNAFLTRCEARGEDYLNALQARIALLASPPPQLIDAVDAMLKSRSSRADDTRHSKL